MSKSKKISETVVESAVVANTKYQSFKKENPMPKINTVNAGTESSPFPVEIVEAAKETSKPKPKPKAKKGRTGMPKNAPVDEILGTNHPDYVSPEVIAYNEKYGITEEQTREVARQQRSQQPKTIDTVIRVKTPVDLAREMPIADRVKLERRAAVVDGRDPKSITAENVDEVQQQRFSGSLKGPKSASGATTKPAAVKVMTPVKNSYGVDLQKTESGKFVFFGHPVTGIFRWMGAKGWSVDQAMTCLANLGITEEDVSRSTAYIQTKAGQKGGDCGGRGPVPELTEEQGASLIRAATPLVK